MGLEINTNSVVTKYNNTDNDYEQVTKTDDNDESIFVTAENNEPEVKSTTEPEPVDPPKGNKNKKNSDKVKAEKQEAVEEQNKPETKASTETKTNEGPDDSEEPEASEYDPSKDKWGDEDSETKKNKKKFHISTPFRLKKCDGKVYLGEITLRPGVYAGYNKERGLYAGGIYGVRYKDTAGVDNLTTNAAVYLDYSKKNLSEGGKRSSVGTGIEASFEYQGECDAPKIYGYGGASAKVGYQNNDTKWVYKDEFNNTSTQLKTNTQQALGELMFHGGFKYETKSRKSKTQYYVKSGVCAGFDANYYSSRTRNADSKITKPVDLPETVYLPRYNSVRPVIGPELEIGFETKRGFGGSVNLQTGLIYTQNAQRDRFYEQQAPNPEIVQNDALANKNFDFNLKAEVKFNIGGKKR